MKILDTFAGSGLITPISRKYELNRETADNQDYVIE